MTEDTKMPMDAMEDISPPANIEQDQQKADDRTRDEQGRFVPKQNEGDGPRGKPDQDVAIRRYAQERDEARKAAEEAKAAHEALQKRLDDMSAIASGKDPNDTAQPDPLKPLVEKIEAIDKRLQTNDEQRQAEAFESQVRQYADMDEQRFRQQQPDFPNAVQHYITSRINELQAFGIPPEQAEQALMAEAQQLLRESALNNRSPAESIYKMAVARGYSPGNVVPFQPQQQQRQNGTPGGRSFGNGAGAAPGAVTAQQLASMSEEDYNAFRQTPEGRAAIKRAMGG